MDINDFAIVVGLLFWPVVMFIWLLSWASSAGKPRSSTPPARGLTKEEEEIDAIAGEMWREMGGGG